MNAKWCISTLIVIIALLGLGQQHKKASNQQILLQFTDVEIASEDARDEVLSIIRTKLLFLGIKDIEVIENDGGSLNIRYYSDIDARGVKDYLSNNIEFSLAYDHQVPSDDPKEQVPDKYSLVVSDLHQYTNNGLNLSGDPVLTQKDYNVFPNPVILNNHRPLVLNLVETDKVALRIYKNIAIAINNTSQNIPGVRAGPNFYGIS